GCSLGICSSSVRSFRLNNPPTMKDVEFQELKAGTELKLLLKGSDEDDGSSSLQYELVEGPQGMFLDSSTGLLRWKPRSEDVMLHQVTVSISDGTDTETMVFTIEVLDSGEDRGGSAPIVIGAAAGAACLLISAIAVALVYMKKRKTAADDDDGKRRESGRTEEPKPASSTYSSVTISASEAHVADHVQHNTTYEGLYGKRKEGSGEEGMTARELKDYIHDQITELEKK
ncbi:MAG: Ig domain-containing protein, partial [Thermoplasmatota archaeon]